MTTIVTRAGKGSSLSWSEVDTNFNNLNTDKIETSALGVTVQEFSANLDTFSTVAPTAAGLALLDDADATAQRNTLGLNNVDNTSDATKNAATATLTNKTITAAKLKAAQLGDSGTATNNFTLTAEAVDGTMKLARGNAGATTQDILTVDANGVVRMPQTPVIGFTATRASSGIGTSGTLTFTTTRNDGGYFTGTRFTPLVAGYYSFTINGQFTIATMTYAGLSILLNGANEGYQYQGPYATNSALVSAGCVTYMNGTTDYIEFSYSAGPTGGTLNSAHCAGTLIQRTS